MATPLPAGTAQPIILMTRARGVTVPNPTIAADAVMTESHSGSNTITDHPVETGFNASDHSRPNPDQLSVEIYVSDTPLSIDQMQRAQNFMQQSGILNPYGPSSVPTGLLAPYGPGINQVQAVPGYSRAVRDRLQNYRITGTLLTVSTAIKTYTSMMIESISENRSAQDAEALHATINFKFIRVVQNQLVKRVVASDPRVGPKVKTGNQTVQQDAIPDSQLLKGQENAAGKTGVAAFGAFGAGVFGFGGN